jgi:acetoin:2,6-dichlorophenolindophenol oxidoreductase subunit beta
MKTAESINGLTAINMALHDAMEADKNVIVLGEDVADPEGGGVVGTTRGLSEKFGAKRVRSTPISEQAIIGASIGASLVGMRPVAELMLMNFTTVAMDMIVNHAAKLRFMSGGQTHVPITIRTMTGAGFGNGGQHSDFLEAWFAHTAGLKVVIPSSPADAYGLMLSCIADDDPCIFVEALSVLFTPGTPPERGKAIPLGKANVVAEGSDVTVITYGPQVGIATAVAEKLKGSISVEVLDLRSVAPLDNEAILRSVRKTRRAVIIHEAVKKHGVGAEIAASISEALFDDLLAPVLRVAARFSPVPFSKPLEAAYLPTADELEAAVRSSFSRGARS